MKFHLGVGLAIAERMSASKMVPKFLVKDTSRIAKCHKEEPTFVVVSKGGVSIPTILHCSLPH